MPKSKLNKNDGDDLRTGRYKKINGKLVRVGDTKVLNRYHGTPQPSGTYISEFKLKPTKFKGRDALNSLPTLYTTIDKNIAVQYAYGASANAPDDAGVMQHQVYNLSLTPSEIIDLRNCENDYDIRHAHKLGADVIECSDFEEVPETVVFNNRIIRIKSVTDADTGQRIVHKKNKTTEFVPPEDIYLTQHGVIGPKALNYLNRFYNLSGEESESAQRDIFSDYIFATTIYAYTDYEQDVYLYNDGSIIYHDDVTELFHGGNLDLEQETKNKIDKYLHNNVEQKDRLRLGPISKINITERDRNLSNSFLFNPFEGRESDEEYEEYEEYNDEDTDDTINDILNQEDKNKASILNEFLNKDVKILEIGSGYGITAGRLAGHGFNIIASDIAPRDIDKVISLEEKEIKEDDLFQRVNVLNQEALHAIIRNQNSDVLLVEHPPVYGGNDTDWLSTAIDKFNGNLIILRSNEPLPINLSSEWRLLTDLDPVYDSPYYDPDNDIVPDSLFVYARNDYEQYINPNYEIKGIDTERYDQIVADIKMKQHQRLVKDDIMPGSSEYNMLMGNYVPSEDQIFADYNVFDYIQSRNQEDKNYYNDQYIDTLDKDYYDRNSNLQKKIKNGLSRFKKLRRSDNDLITSDVARTRLSKKLEQNESSKVNAERQHTVNEIRTSCKVNNLFTNRRGKNNLYKYEYESQLPQSITRSKPENKILSQGVAAQARILATT